VHGYHTAQTNTTGLPHAAVFDCCIIGHRQFLHQEGGTILRTSQYSRIAYRSQRHQAVDVTQETADGSGCLLLL
jgi:hypothetical protein